MNSVSISKERLKVLTEAAIVEAELDALLDLDVQKRDQTLELMSERQPARAETLRSWLNAIEDSKGFLEFSAERVLTCGEPLVLQLEHWRLLMCLHRCSAYDLYLGEAPKNKGSSQVSIKVFHKDPYSFVNLSQIRQTLLELKHPNIAQVLDVGRDDIGRLYCVTESAEGVPLDEWLKRTQPSLEKRVACFEGIASAVSFAHVCSAVHSDLTPETILIGSDGQAKLFHFRPSTRFGLGSSVQQAFFNAGDVNASELTAHTDSAEFQDMRDLGRLLYYILTGRTPCQTLDVCWPVPSALCTENGVEQSRVQGELDQICMRMIDGNSERGYAGLHEVVADIQYWLHCGFDLTSGASVLRRTDRSFWKKKNKWTSFW
jgi:hypothetical protein